MTQGGQTGFQRRILQDERLGITPVSTSVSHGYHVGINQSEPKK
jgi:hypothetical protein